MINFIYFKRIFILFRCNIRSIHINIFKKNLNIFYKIAIIYIFRYYFQYHYIYHYIFDFIKLLQLLLHS